MHDFFVLSVESFLGEMNAWSPGLVSGAGLVSGQKCRQASSFPLSHGPASLETGD